MNFFVLYTQHEPNSTYVYSGYRDFESCLLDARIYAKQGREWAIKLNGIYYSISKGFESDWLEWRGGVSTRNMGSATGYSDINLVQS